MPKTIVAGLKASPDNLKKDKAKIHNGWVKPSTRSPGLKTNPLPWTKLSTYLKLMKASSLTQARKNIREPLNTSTAIFSKMNHQRCRFIILFSS
jgi:hypothetical protein